MSRYPGQYDKCRRLVIRLRRCDRQLAFQCGNSVSRQSAVDLRDLFLSLFLFLVPSRVYQSIISTPYLLSRCSTLSVTDIGGGHNVSIERSNNYRLRYLKAKTERRQYRGPCDAVSYMYERRVSEQPVSAGPMSDMK